MSRFRYRAASSNSCAADAAFIAPSSFRSSGRTRPDRNSITESITAP